MAISSLLIVYLVSVVGDSIGFIKTGYFASLGCNLSVIANGITFLIIFRKTLTPFTIAFSLLLAIYALRLGIFLFIRERRSSSYRNKVKGKNIDGPNMNFIGKCATCLTCAFIYTCEVSPVFFRLFNGTPDNFMLYIGFSISFIGFLFESIGDYQKHRAKKENPTTFVSTGLYKIVRCPNYLGEILVWTGVYVSGITSYNTIWQWIIATIGYSCILSVMSNAIYLLKVRQNKSYGNDEKYQEYVKKTPMIIPFII